MIRILALLLLLLLAPYAHAQSNEDMRFEVQIREEFARVQQALRQQGVQVPQDYSTQRMENGFSGDDWRSDLGRYHGDKGRCC